MSQLCPTPIPTRMTGMYSKQGDVWKAPIHKLNEAEDAHLLALSYSILSNKNSEQHSGDSMNFTPSLIRISRHSSVLDFHCRYIAEESLSILSSPRSLLQVHANHWPSSVSNFGYILFVLLTRDAKQTAVIACSHYLLWPAFCFHWLKSPLGYKKTIVFHVSICFTMLVSWAVQGKKKKKRRQHFWTALHVQWHE